MVLYCVAFNPSIDNKDRRFSFKISRFLESRAPNPLVDKCYKVYYNILKDVVHYYFR